MGYNLFKTEVTFFGGNCAVRLFADKFTKRHFILDITSDIYIASDITAFKAQDILSLSFHN